jgi:phosphomevalonate kinase
VSARAFEAPGKVVLLGDYAVLEGARAMVAAVDRRARAELHEAAAADTVAASGAIVDGVREALIARGLTSRAGTLTIDTSRFADEAGRKLGIGSSAAAALLATAAWLDRADDEVLAIAVDAHRRATGGGSGVDLAACFHGGVVATARQPAPVTPLAGAPPPGLAFDVLGADESASTADMVARARRAPRWREWCGVLGGLAEDGLRAWSMRDGPAFLAAVAKAGRALDALGVEAAAPIVTPPMREAMTLAGRVGAALKPSGAGGGDVVVLFAPREARDALVEAIARETGLRPLGLAIDRRGLDAAE